MCNKRREFTLHHNIYLGQTEDLFFCVSLVLHTCSVWGNTLSSICRSIRGHFKHTVDTFIVCRSWRMLADVCTCGWRALTRRPATSGSSTSTWGSTRSAGPHTTAARTGHPLVRIYLYFMFFVGLSFGEEIFRLTLWVYSCKLIVFYAPRKISGEHIVAALSVRPYVPFVSGP